MDNPELLQQLRRLLMADLIVEEMSDQFMFRHALIREAIYGSTLIKERQHYHRKIAETLERIYASMLDKHAADLAYHYFLAEVWDKALEYSQQAGEKAQSLYAPHEASVHFTRALEAARRGEIPAPAGLHHKRGQVYEVLGDFKLAREDYEQALEAARQPGDQMAEWQGLMSLGFLWASRDYAQTGDYYHQALTLARQMGVAHTLAYTLNRVGNWYLNKDQPRVALQHHREALDLFLRLNDRTGLAQTQDLLALSGGQLLDPETVEYYDQAILLFREIDDRYGLISSMTLGGLFRAIIGDAISNGQRMPRALDDLEQAIQMARESGWRSGEAFGLIEMSWVLEMHGNYISALSLGQQGLRIAEEIEHRQWMTAGDFVSGMVYLDLLALAPARQHLERGLAIAREIGSSIWIHSTTGQLAQVYILQNELGLAEVILDEAGRYDAPETWYQCLCCYSRAYLALRKGEPDVALRRIEQLELSTANSKGQLDRLTPQLSRLHGEALAASGQMAAAEDALLLAGQRALKRGNRFLEWRIHASLGKLYLDQGRHSEARGELATARRLVDEIAAGLADEALRDTFLRTAGSLMPA